jgi:hypothetical protein
MHEAVLSSQPYLGVGVREPAMLGRLRDQIHQEFEKEGSCHLCPLATWKE